MFPGIILQHILIIKINHHIVKKIWNYDIAADLPAPGFSCRAGIILSV